MSEVLSAARGRRPRVVLKTEGTGFPNSPGLRAPPDLGGDDLLAGKKVTKSPNACVEIGKETQ